MKKILFSVLCCSTLSAMAQAPSKEVLKYVKPLIGTARMGHTYPGATVPFGSVQLSPETDTIPYEMNGRYNGDVYKYCAGYQYEDQTIVGFSHTHFSGTGHSDLGDFLIMPTQGKLQLNPGTAANPETGYRSKFSHANEVSEAGYYKVKLDENDIIAELTATNRVGVHQYTFNNAGDAHIILDLMSGIYNYKEKNTWTFVRVENDTLITGFRQTNGWARTRTVYFAMVFSKPFKQYGHEKQDRQVYQGFWRKFDQSKNFPEMAGHNIRAYFDFDAKAGEKIKIKFAISPVSTEGAMKNLVAEAPGFDFDQIKEEARASWAKELHKIDVNMVSEDEKTNFYTAMYHSFINPTTYMDVDGQYRGLDMNIHTAKDFTNYTTFSLWDTYRAQHPFLNLVQPTRNADMVKSMLAHFDQSAQKMLPVWSHYANENWCMIGYHAVPVIADAIMKGNAPFNAEKALEACVTTARHRTYDGIGYYMDMGYVPEDKNGSSVSKTLEYAYDDWCIAQVAKKLGKNDIYEEFIKRSQNYKNVWDASIGFMRPRLSDGTFRQKFDPLKTDGQGFIEGNAWNYSLYVPHYPAEMIEMMGGKKQFAQHLDSLFTMHLPDEFFAETEDITRDGIIGNYVHGNEPSHHTVYLYNFTTEPWQAQSRVRMILKKMYRPTPDGLGGNDDCGQMSAWYIFSSLGFYPICPGSQEYQLGSPAVKDAKLKLENGKEFVVEAKNQSDANVYVQKVELNGKVLNRRYITHEEIVNGGKLVFYMSAKPNKRV
ncbi:putative alpha-1,2-mannosidase [Chitinophaga skermanii]|uniref:Putative alpha-1,2-mannosidase n=1 Tax=Chitinophaga skermanii TaxID=331697 RepID=A0A327R3N8_9BACT|nr:GH92 family glycosyl hydrolase [Chitinophaga skermanii]RAJ10668.1 putative alpha-1,2-mannosidase [Chitinophaga skermanii]